MALSIGIVGLPNVGKSTLFNALSSAATAQAANYPFCTIEPNVGVVPVPDDRLDKLTGLVKPLKKVPTVLEFVDIAGLVRGASKGEGLGNQFLANIRQVNAVLHVLRCFEDENVTHVEGSVNPVRDRDTVDLELCLKDLETVDKRIEKQQRTAKAGGKPGEEAKLELVLLDKIKKGLNDGKTIRAQHLTEEEHEMIKELFLLTDKPVLYVANVSDKEIGSEDSSKHVQAVKEMAKAEGAEVVVLAAAIEAEIQQLPESERPEFLQSVGLTEPGLHKVARGGYKLLGLQTYFTVGEQECRAWTIQRGWKAPQAAGVIHTDFERGFIKAEVYNWKELLDAGSEAALRQTGKLRVEGKEYVVQDGDCMHFRFNV
ncbi:MAG: redox-regulated ATPase YchF [Myxococcaceae bacterium]